MKLNIFKLMFILLPAFVLVACLGETEVTDPSTAPYFSSLRFGENDSIPNLEDAVFTLEKDTVLGDSIIVNLDSLPMNTRIDSVFPTFTWYSTSKTFVTVRDSLQTGLDTIYLTGKDTIDFTRVVSVTNIAEDELTQKTYRIKVNVHTQEGELYIWQRLHPQVYAHSGSEQKAIYFKNKFFFYVSSGVSNYLYTAPSADDWSIANVTGLPLGANLRSIVEYNGKLYLPFNGSSVYVSSDGYSWTAQAVTPADYSLENIMFELNGKLWGIVKSNATSEYHFADSETATNWTVKGTVPENFPVGDYAAVSFTSRTKKPKALVLGGFNAKGQLLRNVWSTENASYWVDFSLENTTLASLSGATVVPYDDKLLLFGGMDASDNVLENYYLQSIDEGLSWQVNDTNYNSLYDSIQGIAYTPRSYQSVIHLPASHQLFLIGGKTKYQVLSDVWAGKLNRLSFIIQ